MSQNYYLYNLKQIFSTKHFKGWGRKKTGYFALYCHKIFGGDLTLLEDGFIRSLGLGVENSPSFSYVEDKFGIYYDATTTSTLENILNTYEFSNTLLQQSQKAIDYILKYEISKYNNAPKVPQDYFQDDFDKNLAKVLIIAQTYGDCSLKYGYGETFSTQTILKAAINENPNAKIYLKIHPDVLNGTKESDLNMQDIPTNITIITENFNPISLLKYFQKVYTKTSQMGFEALLVGCECICFGAPFYAGWGLTKDRIPIPRRRKSLSLVEIFAGAYILYTRYYNPIFQRDSNLLDTLETIKNYRYYKTNKKAFMFGFSLWKHHFIFGYNKSKPNFLQPFMPQFKPQNIIFINPLLTTPLKSALKKGLNQDCEIFIWGKKDFQDIQSYALKNTIPITRVEDGFIRSLSLGSDLTRPFSLVFDNIGIYFDPTQPSRLENILQNTSFPPALIEEAKLLKKEILKNKISKYNIDSHKTLNIPQNKTIILVSGQVEDDASIAYGSPGETNLSLLKQVRKENPQSYILYKPHPDVLSGNRIGQIAPQIALKYCDEIIDNVSLSSAIEVVDEVHTLTSLSGFEALLYGKKVVTYGMPFYAGWGLTIDKQTNPRRNRKLNLEELIAGAYILYPQYIHPKTLQTCSPNVLIKALQEEKTKINKNKFYAMKYKIYSFLSRKAQRLCLCLKL